MSSMLLLDEAVSSEV